jgi:hypothetical protein
MTRGACGDVAVKVERETENVIASFWRETRDPEGV